MSRRGQILAQRYLPTSLYRSRKRVCFHNRLELFQWRQPVASSTLSCSRLSILVRTLLIGTNSEGNSSWDRNVIALTTIDALSTACIAASETRRRSLRRATLHSPYASNYKHAVTHSEMTGREKWSPLRKPFSTVHVRSKLKIIGVICEDNTSPFGYRIHVAYYQGW